MVAVVGGGNPSYHLISILHDCDSYWYVPALLGS